MKSPKARSPHAASLAGPWGVVAVFLAIAMGAAITVGTDQAGLGRPIGFLAGIVVAGLGVGALPSFPTRLVVTGILALGGLVLVRHIQVASVDGVLVLVFVVAAIITLILAERVHASESQRLAPVSSPWRGTVRSIAAVGALVLVVTTLLAPVVGRTMHQDVRSGDDGNPFTDPESSAMLSAVNAMDTHTRPRLSDRVVMTVEAERPSFWRGATFDRWDGGRWTASWSDGHGDRRASALIPAPGGWEQVVPAPEDPAVDNGVTNRQTFTMRAPYSEVLYAAPSAVRVRSDRVVGQRADGSLVSPRPLGTGSTYTVESKMPNATPASLRAAGTDGVPDNVARNALDPGVVSTRVRNLAIEITREAPTNFDKVRAITEWLGANTSYSLDAPLPPDDGTDTVDYFLFESKQGWCEQIASALTVMLRTVGVPARIATGFATGGNDVLTGRYTVREKDAHAWSEVYFPGIGWQGFDPTASVPLAGETPEANTTFGWLKDHALAVIVGVLALIGAGFLGAWLRSQWRRRADRSQRSWAATTLDELEAIGREVRRARDPAETPTQYAAAVGAVIAEPELVSVGAAIDSVGFGPDPLPSPAVRAHCDTVISRARASRARTGRAR